MDSCYTVGVFTTSLVSETWELLARSVEDELHVAIVIRVKHYGPMPDKTTMWKLVRYQDGWRSVGQWISKGCYRKFPERRGVKLSDSLIDQALLKLAEGR